MTPSAAEEKGYERVSKYPKSTKYGRQNPTAERWNSEEQLVLWRVAWADVTNRHLETSGHEEHIDHRSHADRSLTEQPTIHEGVVARALEKNLIRLSCLTASEMFLNYWRKKQRYSLFVSICRKNRSRLPSVKNFKETRERTVNFTKDFRSNDMKS